MRLLKRIKHAFLRQLSGFWPKPIQLGYRFTSDADTVYEIDPTMREPTKLGFFKLRDELGYFEIRGIADIRGMAVYTLYCIDTDTEYLINKRLFDFLFEETTEQTTLPIKGRP